MGTLSPNNLADQAGTLDRGGFTRAQHRHALGQQHGQEVTLLLGPQSLDVGIFRGTFCSAIPAEIIVVAIPILFAVGFIVVFFRLTRSCKVKPSCAVTKLTLA